MIGISPDMVRESWGISFLRLGDKFLTKITVFLITGNFAIDKFVL